MPLRPFNLLTVASSVLLIFTSFHATAACPQKGQPANVVVGNVAKVAGTRTESFLGTFEAIRQSTVGSAVDGRVVSIDVMPGNSVDDSQVIAKLRTQTLEIEIGAAELQLKLMQQALTELETMLPKDLELAEARVRETAATMEFSKTEYDRSRRLRVNGGAISQGELELARSKSTADRQAAKAAQIEFEKINATKEVRLAQSRLGVDVALQELERLKDLQAKYTIRAPYKSVVTQKLTDIGEWVTTGQPIVEVLQLDPIVLVINVPQEQLPLIQTSMTQRGNFKPLTASVDIDGMQTSMQGVVTGIVSQADLRSRTFPVRIEVPNEKRVDRYLLLPGMLGKATLDVGSSAKSLAVKKDALVLDSGSKSVFKIIERDGRKIAVEVPIESGIAFGDWIQVAGDISLNDKVVLMGNERLRNGDEVSISKMITETPAAN